MLLSQKFYFDPCGLFSQLPTQMHKAQLTLTKAEEKLGIDMYTLQNSMIFVPIILHTETDLSAHIHTLFET